MHGPGEHKVLNVGGNSKAIALPPHFDGWQHILLDIDPAGQPDILCDARRLRELDANQFDAIYCSHNLEHYHRHELPTVLQGFVHVLKPTGFAHIRVPDLGQVFKLVVKHGLDIEDVLYEVPAGPVHVHDVLYGWQRQIEKSGTDYFAHKNGFTRKSLVRALLANGFNWVYRKVETLNVIAFAFIEKPNRAMLESLNISPADVQDAASGEAPKSV